MVFSELKNSLFDKRGYAITTINPLKLHIGGKEKCSGWHILDSLDSDVVDFLGECSDLSQFPDACCSKIYCSHVLEHLSHNGELETTLQGFHRILRPTGQLMISVPDLEILCRIFCSPQLKINQKHFVMRMIFGGQIDQHDFHKTGFNYEILKHYLTASGFNNVQKTADFDLFNDTSKLKVFGHAISLNIIATP